MTVADLGRPTPDPGAPRAQRRSIIILHGFGLSLRIPSGQLSAWRRAQAFGRSDGPSRPDLSRPLP